MKEDPSINIKHYNLLRKEIGIGIDNYYQFIIKKRIPTSFMDLNNFIPIFNNIEKVIHNAEKNKLKSKDPKIIGIYDGKKYLSREFDHPGRMILYASHLLSQINKPYDLLINILNGSAEIGLGIQTIDNILKTNCIRDSIIYDVDFARYSMKDRKQKEIPNYFKFEKIAIPNQLRKIFRQKIENKDLLVIDDNLSTGQSLYNVQKALNEIANSVDISVVEIVPYARVIEILKEKKINLKIILKETDLTYLPIGWWRDQIELNKNKSIKKIIGLLKI